MAISIYSSIEMAMEHQDTEWKRLYTCIYYIFYVTYYTCKYAFTYTFSPLSPSSWLRARRIKRCERPCACIELHGVSPRMQSHIISLYDYVIKTVSLSIYTSMNNSSDRGGTDPHIDIWMSHCIHSEWVMKSHMKWAMTHVWMRHGTCVPWLCNIRAMTVCHDSLLYGSWEMKSKYFGICEMIQPCSSIESLSLSPFLPTPPSPTNSHNRDLPPIPLFLPFFVCESWICALCRERGRGREREGGGEREGEIDR